MIKKYKLDVFDSLVSAKDGYLVYYDDYQKLKAENKRLRAAFNGDVGSLANCVSDLMEIAMLTEKLNEIARCLANAYEHIQYKCYNDALSSILEAKDHVRQINESAPDNWIDVNERLPGFMALALSGDKR